MFKSGLWYKKIHRRPLLYGKRFNSTMINTIFICIQDCGLTKYMLLIHHFYSNSTFKLTARLLLGLSIFAYLLALKEGFYFFLLINT